MGYELHIERAHPDSIGKEEWLALVERDPELQRDAANGECFVRFLGECRYGHGEGWFDWHAGAISSKHPDAALLKKMLQMAEALGAVVRGDDGEIYSTADFDASAASPSSGFKLWRRKTRNRLLSFFTAERDDTPLPFKVGDRVKSLNRVGVVKRIDRRANFGKGEVVVEFEDGQCMRQWITAHGLEPVAVSPADSIDNGRRQ